MSIPSFSEFPDIPQRSAPEADFDAKMYALFQHFAVTHRNEFIALADWITNNIALIGDELNGVSIGQTTAAAGKFTTLLADSLGGDAVQASETDGTVDRLLKVGAFGVGCDGAKTTPVIADIDSHDTKTGRYAVSNNTPGTRPPGSSTFAFIAVDRQADTGIKQVWANSNGQALAYRTGTSGVWSAWKEIYAEGSSPAFASMSASGQATFSYSSRGAVKIESGFPSLTFKNTAGGADMQEVTFSNSNDRIGVYQYSDAGGFLADLYAIGLTATGADYHKWNVGAPEKMRLNSLGLGVGKSNPSHTLDVDGIIRCGDGSALPSLAGGTAAIVANTSGINDWASLSVIAGTGGKSSVYFGDADAEDRGYIKYDHTSDEMKLGTAAADAVTIGSSGNVGIGTTGPGSKLHAYESAQAVTVTRLQATHASYTGAIDFLYADRAAAADYKFLEARSGGSAGDLEFRLSGDGNGTCDGSWTGGGADYAEFFEWADGNPLSEVRTGLPVVLEGDKIRPALDGEQPIGVISANPSVVGDGDIDRWKGKYLRDDFGAYIWEEFEALSWAETVTDTETVKEQAVELQERSREVVSVSDGKAVRRVITETVPVPLFDEFPLFDEAGDPVTEQVLVGMSEPVLDDDGNKVEPAQPVYEARQAVHLEPRMVEVQRETSREVQHSYAADEVPEGLTVPDDAERTTLKRRTVNPAYDPAQEYTPRAERKEWDTVGLMGKLRLRKGQPVADSWLKMREVSADVEEWLVR